MRTIKLIIGIVLLLMLGYTANAQSIAEQNRDKKHVMSVISTANKVVVLEKSKMEVFDGYSKSFYYIMRIETKKENYKIDVHINYIDGKIAGIWIMKNGYDIYVNEFN